MKRARQSLCRRPQKLLGQAVQELSNGKTLSSEIFLRLHASTTWFLRLLPRAKWRLVIFRQSRAFFFVWAGHDIQVMVRSFISLQPLMQGCAFALVQRHLCWCSLQTALAGWRCASAAHKFLRRSCACNCQDCPSGPTGGPCASEPAPVAHRYQCKYLAEKNQKCRYSLTYSKHLDKGGGSPQLIITTVREQNPRSNHKGATGRVQTCDQLYPVLCHCQLGQDIPISKEQEQDYNIHHWQGNHGYLYKRNKS